MPKRYTIMVNGKQKLLARVIMEEHLGRPLLSTELVHHINRNPLDNMIENLQVVSRSEHKKIHDEIGMATRLKKKTHCLRMHKFSGNNLIIDNNWIGRRRCKACQKLLWKRRNTAKFKAARAAYERARRTRMKENEILSAG